jgi:hypothetical protein
VPRPWTPRWADSAAVLGAVLDTLAAQRRTEPLVVRLRSCQHLPPPCAQYGGWATDSVRARALLTARGLASAPPSGTAPGHPVHTLGAPRFRNADTAVVSVDYHRGTGNAPGTAFAADAMVFLVRRADGWHVVEWRTTRMT